MYGGGSQLDPRDSIADTTPLSIIEAQKEIEEADITPDEDEDDQPKALDMTQEEVDAVSQICFQGNHNLLPYLLFRKDKQEEKR